MFVLDHEYPPSYIPPTSPRVYEQLTLTGCVAGGNFNGRVISHPTISTGAGNEIDVSANLAALQDSLRGLPGYFHVIPGNCDIASLPGAEGDEPPGAGFRAGISPVPCRGKARIAFNLPRTAPVEITIVDGQGRLVTCLGTATYASGSHSVTWDATREPDGIYFAVLRMAGEMRARKVVVVKESR